MLDVVQYIVIAAIVVAIGWFVWTRRRRAPPPAEPTTRRPARRPGQSNSASHDATTADTSPSRPLRSWPAVDPVVGDRPGIVAVHRVSSSGVPNGSVVPWTNRHGTVSRRKVLDAQRVRLARRVQRVRDEHDAGDRLGRRLAVGAGGDHRADPSAHRSAADDDPTVVRWRPARRAPPPSARAGGRAPAGPPCGTGSRPARSSTPVPRPVRRRRASTGHGVAPAPGNSNSVERRRRVTRALCR